MAVREGLLALLLPGENYGFRLHLEWMRRTGSRRQVNVGQTYATLNRLVKSALVEPAGATDDGLELYRLTASGRATAHAWLHGADAVGAEPWDEMTDRVLLTLSLPTPVDDLDVDEVLAAQRASWRASLADIEVGAEAVAQEAVRAQLTKSAAALSWLDEVSDRYHAAPDEFALEFSTARPRRGRPAAAPKPATEQVS